MSLIRPQAPSVLDETVTIRIVDLYDYLITHLKESPMPELNQLPTPKRAKRGYRKVTMVLKSEDYRHLELLADEESRTPDQQAAYLLRQKLAEINVRRAENGVAEATATLDDLEAQVELEERPF